MLEDTNLETIPERHPIRLFHACWISNLNSDGNFVREHFKPMQIPKILPWLIILEPVSLGKEIRYLIRLYGSGVGTLLNTELTGKYVGEDISDELRFQLEKKFRSALEVRVPMFSELPVPIQGREFIYMYHGIFPVFAEKTNSHQIFVVMAEQEMRIS